MFKQLWSIYHEGFGHLPQWGKALLIIVIAKLFILLFIFKLWLMPNYLNRQYTSKQEKSEHVINVLITKP